MCYCVGPPPGPGRGPRAGGPSGTLRLSPCVAVQRRVARPTFSSRPFPTASHPILSRSLNVDQPWRGVTERAPAQRPLAPCPARRQPRCAAPCPALPCPSPDPSPTRFSGWPGPELGRAESGAGCAAQRGVGVRGGVQWSRVWCKLGEWGTG